MYHRVPGGWHLIIKNPLEFWTQNQGHGKQRQHSWSAISAKQSLGLQQQIEGGAKLPAEVVRDAKVHEAELGNGTKSVVKMVIGIKNVKNLKHVKNAKIEDELMIHSTRWQASAGTSAPSVSARKSRRTKSGHGQNGKQDTEQVWELAIRWNSEMWEDWDRK